MKMTDESHCTCHDGFEGECYFCAYLKEPKP